MLVQPFDVVDQGLVTNAKFRTQESEGVTFLQFCPNKAISAGELWDPHYVISEIAHLILC